MRIRLASKIFFTLFIVSILLVGNSSAIAKDRTLLSIATASTGGSWYPAGGAVASIINKYIPDVEASAHPSAASRENIRLINQKTAQLAMTQPDVAYFALSGTDVYKDKDPADIAGLFFVSMQLIMKLINRFDTRNPRKDEFSPSPKTDMDMGSNTSYTDF